MASRSRLSGIDLDAIVLGEYAENELRKDFTVSERVAIGRAVEAALGERRGRPSEEKVQNFAQFTEPGQKTRDVAATKAGFGNETTYRQAKAVIDQGAPELIEAVDRGDVSISAAATIAELPRDEQKAIVEAGPGKVIDAAKAARTVRAKQKDAQNRQTAAKPAVIPAGKFGTGGDRTGGRTGAGGKARAAVRRKCARLHTIWREDQGHSWRARRLHVGRYIRAREEGHRG